VAIFENLTSAQQTDISYPIYRFLTALILTHRQNELDMPKFAVIVVTYFPDAEIIHNLIQISDKCKNVIVIDNTPGSAGIEIPNIKNIKVLKNKKNMGLAFALNMGMNSAGKEGVENIFLLDQDSRPSDHYFNEMLAFKSQMACQYDRWAFYVPNFYDRNSKTFARFPLLTRCTLTHATCKNVGSVQGDRAAIAITSGMLISYSRFREIGPFREDYFIDFVDNEYCLKAAQKGYRIGVNCDTILDHAIGNRSLHRFFGLTVKPNHHLPLRRYYIARNGVRTAIDFVLPYPSYVPLIFARMLHEFISILLYEDQKSKKIRAMICGIYHGLTGRMGNCSIGSLMSDYS